jgi:AcrR family transcriptional regulator
VTGATRDREATRQRILRAAERQFAKHGYEHVTVRAVAAAAGVNVALISRYFGSKMGLFREVVDGDTRFAVVIDGDPDGLPRRMAEFVFAHLRATRVSPAIAAINRSAGSPAVKALLQERLEDMVLAPLTAALGDGPEARMRATVATALFVGTGTVRRLLGPQTWGGADDATVLEELTQIFTLCLRGSTPMAALG